MISQPALIRDPAQFPLCSNAPSTRYQGSKLKLLPWIWDCIRDLRFQTALDVFGGTGSVAYMLKECGKTVTYNDSLRFNYITGKALIENESDRLMPEDVDFLVSKHSLFDYKSFIADTFHDIYFTDEENTWLDVVVQNISQLEGKYKRGLAYYALFQSCIIKRPYNLFHRKNLYMRTSDVKRSFGNKATWETPFERHFRKFVADANSAVFDSGVKCRALCRQAETISEPFDLVYIDPPYLNSKGVGVDYLQFYHFLEGLADYDNWHAKIDFSRKHYPFKNEPSPWCDRDKIADAFSNVIERYKNSKLVISYRGDGVPSEEELLGILHDKGKSVRLYNYGRYKYVLSKNTQSNEILLIAE